MSREKFQPKPALEVRLQAMGHMELLDYALKVRTISEIASAIRVTKLETITKTYRHRQRMPEPRRQLLIHDLARDETRAAAQDLPSKLAVIEPGIVDALHD